MKTGERFARSAEGRYIRVIEAGQGPGVCLLIHGTADGAYIWAEVAGELQRQLRVIAVDLRGHGHSDWSPGKNYDLPHYLADLALLVQEMNLTSVAIVGHSMGADLAIRLASAVPRLVTRLALVDFAPDIKIQVANDVAAMLEEDCQLYSSPDGYLTRLKDRFPLAEDLTLVRLARESLRACPQGGHELRCDPAVMSGNTDPDPPTLWPMLAKLDCPTLIARAIGSAMIPLDSAQRMSQVMSRARLVSIPLSGHAVMIDNPKYLAKTLRLFLAGSEPAQRTL